LDPYSSSRNLQRKVYSLRRSHQEEGVKNLIQVPGTLAQEPFNRVQVSVTDFIQ